MYQKYSFIYIPLSLSLNLSLFLFFYLSVTLSSLLRYSFPSVICHSGLFSSWSSSMFVLLCAFFCLRSEWPRPLFKDSKAPCLFYSDHETTWLDGSLCSPEIRYFWLVRVFTSAHCFRVETWFFSTSESKLVYRIARSKMQSLRYLSCIMLLWYVQNRRKWS